jgi:tRNA/rRNA methyltransferase
MISLDPIRVVLVRPEEAGNVGAAARVMKNFGLRHLVLVDPCLHRPEQAIRFAHGAEDIVEGADQVEGLAEAIAPCVWAWATTRRRGRRRRGGSTPRQAAGKLCTLAGEGAPAAWVFGPESRGLTTDEVGLCSGRVVIPTSPRQPSLNLAQAVAVCSYETLLAANQHREPQGPLPAPLADREALYRHLEAALLSVGFLLPDTAPTRMASLRALLERASPSPREVRLLRAAARRVQWAGEAARVQRKKPERDG